MKKWRVLTTSEFDRWFSKLPLKSQAIVKARLDLLSYGYFGNHKRFQKLIELRWRNGILIYSFIWHKAIIIVLNGGNKNGQKKDIDKAKKIRSEITEGTRTIQTIQK